MALTKVDDRGLNTPIDLLDDEKIRLGTSNEFELYQDSSTDYGILRNMGQGTIIRSAIFNVKNAGATKDMIVATTNGSVDLYYDNSKKLETTTNGADLTGSSTFAQIKLKTSDGTNRGGLYAGSNNDLFLLDGQDHQFIQMTKDGEVTLKHDNTNILRTWSTGVEVFGALYATSVDLNDNQKVLLGTGDDLQIYHDGSNSYLINGTGDLTLQNGSGNTNQIRIRGQNGEESIVANGNGSVDLYYDNGKKLETTTNGIAVTGRIEPTSGVWIGSNQKYRLYDNSGVSRFDTYAYNIEFVNKGTDGSISPYLARMIPSGAVELYHNGNKKVETSSTGATVTGTLTATAFSGAGIIPAGGIIIWSGASNAIPTGWLICDGTNSTPDLRDRFVIGAGNNYAVGATGGSADATLVSHSHTTNTTINPGNTGSKDLQGSVSRVSETYDAHGQATGVFTKGGSTSVNHTPASVDSSNTGSFNFDGRHRHGTDTQGSSATNANLPPYYALCYIMKS